MSDAKNWVMLIVLINLLALPLMWLRQGNAVPQVLGVSEKANATNEDNLNSSDDIFSDLKKNLWGEIGPNSGNRSKIIDTSDYSLDLPTRATPSKINPEDGVKNLKKSNSNINLQGKIMLREGFKSNLAVKDAEIGDKVKIVCSQKELVYTVDSTVLTPDGVIAIANNQVFTLLGVDATQNKEVDCNIKKV